MRPGPECTPKRRTMPPARLQFVGVPPIRQSRILIRGARSASEDDLLPPWGGDSKAIDPGGGRGVRDGMS